MPLSIQIVSTTARGFAPEVSSLYLHRTTTQTIPLPVSSYILENAYGDSVFVMVHLTTASPPCKWALKARDELEYMWIASQKNHCTLLHPYKCHRTVMWSEWQSCKLLFHRDYSPAYNCTQVVVVWRGPSLDGCHKLWLSGLSLSLLWVLVMLELRCYCSKMQSSPCANCRFRSSSHRSLQLSLVLYWRSANIFCEPH